MATLTALTPLNTTVGDLQTALFMQLRRGDGTFPDLSGLLVSDVKVHLKNLDTKEVKIANISAFVSAPNAQVRYDPVVIDVATARNYDVKVRVTHASGKTETFPVCESWRWNVHPGLVPA